VTLAALGPRVNFNATLSMRLRRTLGSQPHGWLLDFQVNHAGAAAPRSGMIGMPHSAFQRTIIYGLTTEPAKVGMSSTSLLRPSNVT
jgi:hypothetical protein